MSVGKKTKPIWLTKRYAFVNDLNHPDTGAQLFVLEWGLYEGGQDDPVRELLQIVDAKQT
jgi:hypothetical protein